MIKIKKPRKVPEILRTRGKIRKDVLCRDYDSNPDYANGTLAFTFDSGVYGHTDVKRSLCDAQHSKCCFCERKIGMDGDVEHFRPKAGYRQGKGDPLQKPGYYWLAYTWDNLLLSCPMCNQRHKGNYFPLADPSRRACSHHDDIRQEQPLFIQPAKMDPEKYISFRKEIPYAIDGNSVGRATIEALGLDGEPLNEPRRDRLALLTGLQRVILLEEELSASPEGRTAVTEAKELIQNAVSDSAEYAAMARAAKAHNFYIDQL